MVNLIRMRLDMTIACTAPNTFENQTCTRCGGCGRYSYNQIDGDRCYGCNGKGITYTKRGAAAAAFLEALRKVRLDQLQVGDFMLNDSTGKFYRVTDIKPNNSVKSQNKTTGVWEVLDYLEVTTERGGLIGPRHTPVRKAFTAEQKAAQMQQALAYQATLTKTGAPRKR